MTRTKLLIGGEEKTSKADPLVVLYPWDQTTEVGSCYRLTEAELPQVLKKARQGYERFQQSKPVARMTILTTLANRLQKERESLARLITLEAGKPLKLSRQEVDRAIRVCRGYAELLNRYDEHWLYVQDRKALIKRFAHGPVLAITPFNFPLNLVMHKLAPAIAAGTSITIKPAPKTPMTALFLGALAVECGYPYLSVVPCDNEIAEQLIHSGAYPKISFTGSSAVGWKIREWAPKAHLTLELGGNSACIVDDFSAGLPAIAKRCAESAFQFAGQSCISLQRIYVQADLYEDFLPALFDAAKKLRVGDPMKPTTDIGPMISLAEVQRVRAWLRDAIEQGANIAFGGTTYNAFTYNPTILNRVSHQMPVVQEEVFAPLLVVHPYQWFEEALDWVNLSRYGLHTGVYTGDMGKLMLAYQTLQVGGVLHNDTPTTRLDELPYGGVKDSGMGREGVLGGIDEMTYVKTCILRQ